MKQSYPTTNVIMLFALLTPMLFGIVMGCRWAYLYCP